jgi:hypothetical protein
MFLPFTGRFVGPSDGSWHNPVAGLAPAPQFGVPPQHRAGSGTQTTKVKLSEEIVRDQFGNMALVERFAHVPVANSRSSRSHNGHHAHHGGSQGHGSASCANCCCHGCQCHCGQVGHGSRGRHGGQNSHGGHNSHNSHHGGHNGHNSHGGHNSRHNGHNSHGGHNSRHNGHNSHGGHGGHQQASMGNSNPAGQFTPADLLNAVAGLRREMRMTPPRDDSAEWVNF